MGDPELLRVLQQDVARNSPRLLIFGLSYVNLKFDLAIEYDYNTNFRALALAVARLFERQMFYRERTILATSGRLEFRGALR